MSNANINRAKCQAIIRELKRRKCDNFKPIGISGKYAVSRLRERRAK